MAKSRSIHVHLVSDSTGDTVHHVAEACLSQFNIEAERHVWSLVRGDAQVKNVLRGLKNYPGIVIATFADGKIGALLREACVKENTPYISVLDPVMDVLSRFAGEKTAEQPGKQHELNPEYFARMEAIDFAMHHDDGQATSDLNEAEVILVGVSRTSKTPTCIYLSHRGVKAANVPVVPGVALPPQLFEPGKALIVALTGDPERLSQIRHSRLAMLGGEDKSASYADIGKIRDEVREASRLFAQQSWPVIDVTRKSVEETAALVLQLYQEHKRKA